MRHANVALFVPDEGCPHRCSFCNQKTISGSVERLSGDDVKSAAEKAIKSGVDPNSSEIAFFGGSFTGIERNYMDELLESAYGYVKAGALKGIRVSTRPDYINEEILVHLKTYGVSAIELGCQSMDDEILRLNGRGHTSADIVNACDLIRRNGFELGVQMMTGLFGDTDEKSILSAKRLIDLSPDTVRIYPTVVLEETSLAELYRVGKYKPQTLDEAVDLCSELMLMFENAGVRVIRLGLHSGGNVDEGYIAGAFHPAFAELCKGKVYLRRILSLIKGMDADKGEIIIEVGSKNISQAVGQKQINKKHLESLGFRPEFRQNDNLKEYEVILTEKGNVCS